MAKCIIISGIDGSGKSTIINETQMALEAEGKKWDIFGSDSTTI